MYAYFITECGDEKICIPLLACPNTIALKQKATEESNFFDQFKIYQTISSLACGQSSEETVCCDKQSKIGKE